MKVICICIDTLKKKTMRIGLLTILLLATTNLIYSQNQTLETPIHFGQFFNNPLLNIAKEGAYSRVSAKIGTKRNIGSFGNVSTSFLSSNFSFLKQKESNNSLGILFYNDKEGEFIRRQRAYISFVRHQQIGSDWKLSLGISGGMHVFNVKFNEIIGGISTTSFDGSVGILLHSFKSKIGLSVNQYPNSVYQPLVQQILLKRHYYLFGEQKIFIKNKTSIVTSIYTKYISSDNSDLGIGLRLLFNTINAGLSYEFKEGCYAFFGINDLKINNHFFDVDFAYFMPSSNNFRRNTNTLELTLKYSLDKKSEDRGYFR